MSTNRRSILGLFAALVGLTGVSTAAAQESRPWDGRYLLLLANAGAHISVDGTVFDPRFLLLLVTTASEHGGGVTIRNATILTPEQSLLLARRGVTFEI